eukprot:4011483-Alexandrium_andersonii.AAC.1
MAPGRAGNSPAKPVSTGGAGERRQVRGKRAAWRTQRPLNEVHGRGRCGHVGFRPARVPELAAPVSPPNPAC